MATPGSVWLDGYCHGHMYLRTIRRTNKDGSQVGYVQLAHNVWDPAKRQSRAQVIHRFGREDRLDRDALARLVRSISRFLEPDEALAARGSARLVSRSSTARGCRCAAGRSTALRGS